MKPTPLSEIAHLLKTSMTQSSARATGVAIDSRLTRPGDLFFALPGAQTDGHLFLQAAASQGAIGAVVRQDYAGPSHGLPLLHSADVLEALQQLAAHFLTSSKTRVVAVTGSLGKTTTKEFIGDLLKSKFKVSVSPGNSNSQLGLPLSILNQETLEKDILILEMGMTLPGHISQLIKIAPPHVAVVTTVALVHACNFDSLADIARAKAEIFTHPKTELGIYHKESDYEQALSQSGTCRKQSFSTTSPQADIYLEAFSEGIKIKDRQGRTSLPPLNVPGGHNRYNFLAAVAVARHFGLEWEEIRAAQASLKLPERRLQPIKKFGALFVNDSYNASEMSMIAALEALPRPNKGGKRIAVLGEMMELGKFSAECHQAVGKHALSRVDVMLCFGEGCQPILHCWQEAGKPVTWAPERGAIVDALRSILQPGDVVLLKGSRSKGVWKVLDEL